MKSREDDDMRLMHLLLAGSALAILAGSDVIAQDQPPAAVPAAMVIAHTIFTHTAMSKAGVLMK